MRIKIKFLWYIGFSYFVVKPTEKSKILQLNCCKLSCSRNFFMVVKRTFEPHVC